MVPMYLDIHVNSANGNSLQSPFSGIHGFFSPDFDTMYTSSENETDVIRYNTKYTIVWCVANDVSICNVNDNGQEELFFYKAKNTKKKKK